MGSPFMEFAAYAAAAEMQRRENEKAEAAREPSHEEWVEVESAVEHGKKLLKTLAREAGIKDE